MSKKRVHEIAKELKAVGIELDNKEVVAELTSLGYDVKSHSSSLEDDQATAAIQKIVDKKKPKAPAPPVAAKGFLVRRKTGATAQASLPAHGADGEHAGDEAGGEHQYGDLQSYAEQPAQAEEYAAEEPQAASEEPAPAEAPAPAPVQAEPAQAEPAAAQAAAPAVAETPDVTAAPAAAPEAAAAPAAAAPSSPQPAQQPAAAAAPVSSPAQESAALPQTPPSPAAPPRTPAPPAAAAAPQQATPPAQRTGTPSGPGAGRPGAPTTRGGSPPMRSATVISRPSQPMAPTYRPGQGPQQQGRPGMQQRPPAQQSSPPQQAAQQQPPPPQRQNPGLTGRPGMAPPMRGLPPPSRQHGRHQSGPGPVVSHAPQPASATPAHAASAQPPAQGSAPVITNVGGVPHAVTPTETRPPRPTATQAVVISRPLIQVRRVTPTTSTQRQYPMAPGKKAIGEVKEFKVVPDHLGRGRELVDVTKAKEKERGARGKRGAPGEGTISKQEISDLVWGRVTIPIRGKKKKPTKKGAKTQITQMAEEKKVIKIQEGISVTDLAQRMGVRNTEIIKKLMAGGKMVTANALVDAETAEIIAADYGWKIQKVGFEVEDYLPEVEARPEDERPRPPVVTVMGHVDHGKTSLLDAIRSASVASGEAGGITQHIGAYTVSTSRGEVTFLDTPGHEAFSSMRSRGANVTDIVILVVAADDGVMPQTVEAIKHAKAAEVPIVVAINKMDVPGANPDRVKKDLAAQELTPEEWGGETIMVPVSAKTKMGLDLLLENVALQAEVLELTANPVRPAVGTIIEAKLEKGRGPVATVLVSEGTLKLGDAVVTGSHYGRVRAMQNSRGEAVKEVLPGYSAEVIGLSGVPSAGDTINAVADEKAAKQIAEHRGMKERQKELGAVANKDTLEALFARQKSGGGPKELRLVIKADVQGSAEAVRQAVDKLSTPKVRVQVLSAGVGAMTETDVMLAAASKGMVIGFNTKAESGTEAAAKAQEVTIQTYSIIYELLDGVRTQMEGLLEPIRTERKLGRAEVRNTFNVPKLGTIAGAAVLEGTVKRGALVRLWRENKQLFTGRMVSLRRFKDDVKEVAQGFECGIGIENFSDLKAGDIIEAYEIEETRPSLS